jgi:hypothetical protein
LEAVRRQAREEGKLIYVFVEGDNCPPCDRFKETHLGDPAYADFVNTLYVPVRVHEDDPAGQSFLDRLRLRHGAVPRFYVLTAEGAGLSMAVGMPAAPPMGAAEALGMAQGKELPVARAAAAALAGRLRAHAAARPGEAPLRRLGLAILEAQAWALALRLDEAEKAFGPDWAGRLSDPEIQRWYVEFWLAWRRNLPAALSEALAWRAADPENPAAALSLGKALAANSRFREAAQAGDAYLSLAPADPAGAAREIDSWRRR